MKREERYLVFKYTDLDELDDHYPNYLRNNLADIIDVVESIREEKGKKPLNCVVIEEDWPEYETVWKLLEERVDNEERT